MALILSGTDGLSDVDGSAATPAIRGTDTNTGVFFPAADTIAFSEGGVEAMRIDSSGNVGIGTSSPSYRLDVQAATAVAQVKSTTGTNAAYYIANNTGGDFYIGRENSAGTTFGTTAYSAVLWSAGAYPMAFFTNGIERARIDSSGNLLVGLTSKINTANGVSLSPTESYFTATNTYVALFNRRGTDGSVLLFQNDESNVGSISVSGTATAYNTSSDYRLKQDIQPMTGALAKVAALNPVTYKWKVDGSDGEGFIAHELAEVVPQCVTGSKDAVDAEGNPVYQGIDTSFLVATLTAAIQEQQAIIQSLTARIEALEGKA